MWAEQMALYLGLPKFIALVDRNSLQRSTHISHDEFQRMNLQHFREVGRGEISFARGLALFFICPDRLQRNRCHYLFSHFRYPKRHHRRLRSRHRRWTSSSAISFDFRSIQKSMIQMSVPRSKIYHPRVRDLVWKQVRLEVGPSFNSIQNA